MILQLKKSNYILRPWIPEDASALCQKLSHPSIREHIRSDISIQPNLDWAKRFIENASHATLPSSFAICDENNLIGSITLKPGEGIYRYSAELTYWLLEDYRNRGVISDAIRTITIYAFQDLNIKRVYSIPLSTNPASCKVLEKAGYQYEGRLRCGVFIEEEFIDQLIYSRTGTVSGME